MYIIKLLIVCVRKEGLRFHPHPEGWGLPAVLFPIPGGETYELEKLNLILEDGTGTSLAVADVLTQLVIGGTTSAAVLVHGIIID